MPNTATVVSTVHVAPVVLAMTGGGPLRDGAVAVEGARVVAVGARADVAAAHPRARAREHRGVLLPGLVNAHARLERGPSFAGLAGLPRADGDEELRRRSAAVEAGDGWLVEARGSVHALLRTGTTCVADVVRVGPGARAAATASLAGVAFLDPDDALGDHARLTRVIPEAGRVLGRGPLGGYVVLRTRRGALRGAPEVSVVRVLDEGLELALGTGSLASVPDLDLLAEARATRDLALRQGVAEAGLAELLVRAVTTGGAAAYGLTGSGTLAPGVRADLAVFDVPTGGDPYDALVEHGAGRCTATVVAGRLVHRR